MVAGEARYFAVNVGNVLVGVVPAHWVHWVYLGRHLGCEAVNLVESQSWASLHWKRGRQNHQVALEVLGHVVLGTFFGPIRVNRRKWGSPQDVRAEEEW